MSKIYDALRKKEAERRAPESHRRRREPDPPRPGPPPRPPRPPKGVPIESGGKDDSGALKLPKLDGHPDRFWRAVTRVAAAIQAGGPTEPRSILFVGTERAAGTTTLALATSILLVRDPGVEVLLIDAHARSDEKPLLPSGNTGLIQLALGKVSIGEAVVPTDQRGLSYLSRGKGSYNGPKLFEKLAPLLLSLRSRYDFLILDAAPVVTAPESAQLAGICDGVVVVLASEKTLKAEALRTKEVLDESEATILGTVINRVRRSALFGQR